MGSRSHPESVCGGPPSSRSRLRRSCHASVWRTLTFPSSSTARPVIVSTQALMRGRSSSTSAGRCHNRAVLGSLLSRLYSLATTMDLPSGLKAKESGRMGLTPSCSRGGPIGRPVAASQSLADLSPLHARMVLQSELYETGVAPDAGTKGGPTGRRSECVHQPGCPVPASDADGLAIRAVRGSVDHALMYNGLPDRPTGGGIPQPRRPITAGREDCLAVRAEGYGVDHASVLQGLSDGLTGGGIPQPCRRRHPPP